ncbi:MAG: exonuclease SbcCD subunit D [Oscillospiraceae bacterium]|nr:exonuclease SbcCD subunit D [Oscillospiraceae bacterium]
MKIFHLSDLHLGKTVHEFSMLEDQRHILLNVILEAVYQEHPDAVFISGDVFDRHIPPAEALNLFDDFLTYLVQQEIKVYIISGNHDSGERLSFGARMFEKSGVYFSSTYKADISPYILTDETLSVNIYLLPFIKPIHVRRHTDLEIKTYSDALKIAIDKLGVDKTQINILLAHQFVTGALISDSEEMSIGGLDNVDAEVFEDFDYVALGHLHRPQYILKESIRYAGSPLKYSFSEIGQDKSITMLTITEKNNISVEMIPLIPKRNMCQLRGRYDELRSKSYYQNLNRDDYYGIVLTDEEDKGNVIANLRVIYPNLMHLSYDNTRTRTTSNVLGLNAETTKLSPMKLFNEFYTEQNGQPISEQQREYISTLIELVFEEETI